ncbi:hypothetical protein BC834DRAFT_858666 [Gloeopeniophorella convolvens]|nr:hypothetical protein BC834DRAFT_858666 [Gloeopeniophorella convolvens]
MVSSIPVDPSGQPGSRSFPRGDSNSINSIPDEILLEIFDRYRLDCRIPHTSKRLSDCFEGGITVPPFWWRVLERVCRRWRQVIRASPGRLALKLYYRRGTSMQSMLKGWPSSYALAALFSRDLYFRKHDLPGLKTILQKAQRFREAILHTRNPSFFPLVDAMMLPAPRLEHLELVHEDKGQRSPVKPFLSPEFLGGHAPNLTFVHLEKLDIRGTPRWLSTSTSLIYLSLQRISISQGALHAVLLGTPRLKTLCIEGWTPSDVGPLSTTHLPEDRAQLHALKTFSFYGSFRELESIASMIDAQPRTTKFATIAFHDVLSDVRHSLRLFAPYRACPDRPLSLRLDAAFAGLTIPGSEGSEWFTSYGDASSLGLIDCLPFATRLCDMFSNMLSDARVLYFSVDTRSSGVPQLDELNATDWRNVLAPFVKTTDFWLNDGLEDKTGKLLEHCTEGGLLDGCLPALQKIVIVYKQKLKRRIPEQRAAFDPYITKRRLSSNHAVELVWEDRRNLCEETKWW